MALTDSTQHLHEEFFRLLFINSIFSFAEFKCTSQVENHQVHDNNDDMIGFKILIDLHNVGIIQSPLNYYLLSNWVNFTSAHSVLSINFESNFVTRGEVCGLEYMMTLATGKYFFLDLKVVGPF